MMNATSTAPVMFLRGLKNIVARTPAAERVLRPVYNAWQTLRYRHLVKANVALKNRYAGQRCFILGTGPSVNELDFDLLRNQHVFACSMLFKHKDFSRLNVSFYSATVPLEPLYGKLVLHEVYSPPDGVRITPENAERVIEDFYSHAAEFFPNLKEMQPEPYHFFSALEKHCPNPDTILFLNAACRSYFDAHDLFRNRRTHYVMNAAPPMERVSVLSHDLAGRQTFVGGGLFFAIAAAIYMGFTEIILCGCGYTYEPIQEFHFFDEPVFPYSFSEAEATSLSHRLAASRDVEVWGIRRAADGYRPMLVRYKTVDPKHHAMREFAEAHGVRILNLVPYGFESPIYQRVSWRSVREDLLVSQQADVQSPAAADKWAQSAPHA